MNKLILLPAALILLLSFCQNETSKGAPNKETAVVATKDTTVAEKKAEEPSVTTNAFDIKTFNAENTFNTTASVLAGMMASSGSFKKYLDSAAWKENASFVDSAWKRLEWTRLAKMRKWKNTEFAAINQNDRTLFYPFSGPDFLTAFTFFPNVEKYIMVGLEPIGKLPEIAKMKENDAAAYVQGFKVSLTDIFSKSYFITRNMNRDLNYQKVNGTLPVLSFFIKRTGNEIANIKYVVKINNDSIIEVPYTYNNKKDLPFGVRIDIVSNGKPKSVYYFRYDVSNKKFNDTAVFYQYLSNLKGTMATYIKSASYLLHNDFMSNMRGFILAKSDDVVQDDTGIPFKYFVEKDNWAYKVYGEYLRPVKDFSWMDRQSELVEAFKKDSATIQKLPFHLGYHWSSNKDVLIVCKKK